MMLDDWKVQLGGLDAEGRGQRRFRANGQVAQASPLGRAVMKGRRPSCHARPNV